MEREEEKKSWHDETLFYWRSKYYLQCIYAKHMGIGYCLLKQWSAYIINTSACIINVWGCAEIFPKIELTFSVYFFLCFIKTPSHFIIFRR